MHSELAQAINRNVSEAKAEHHAAEVGDDSIYVDPSQLKNVCQFLYDSPDYDFNVLQVITGTDYSDRIEVSYVVASFRKNLELILKTKLPKESREAVPEIESVTSIWKSANFLERECYDMVGVHFKNHPDHRRILCPDDWEGYPLRKDYKVQEKYLDMEVNPPHKINTDDHFFGDRMRRQAEDPKKITVSWNVPEFPEEESSEEGNPDA